MALDRTAIGDTEWKATEMQRALTWLFSMQSKNGGWAAFDQDNDHELFNEIPFADHGAMLDPPTVDVTGRILWMLGRINHDVNDPMVQRALQFIKSEQEPDGCWFGRWGGQLYLWDMAGADRFAVHRRRPESGVHPQGR